MATKLTKRQQEVKKLLDKGKKPREIAQQLGISENAVYQQRRRIRQAVVGIADPAAAPDQPAKQRTARRSTRRSTTNRRTSDTPKAVGSALVAKPVTPAEAILARRSVIENQLADSEALLNVARTSYEDAEASHSQLLTEHSAELENLTRAEQALSGKWPKPAANRPRKTAEKAPEPQEDGKAPEAEAPVAAPKPDPGLIGETEAPEAELERAGVPTVPEFAQGNADAF
jgi:hypothetical protein